MPGRRTAEGDVPVPSSRGVTRKTAAEQIIEQLRTQILTGALAIGAKLPTERELGIEFGVSSPTVREALSALSSMGLIEARQGSGAYVAPNLSRIMASAMGMITQLENVGLDDLLGLQSVLNHYAGELAVSRATDEDIARLLEQAEATAAMMGYFADFTGKLSHGVYKMPPNHFNLAWSADKVGAMRNQVYVMGRFDLAEDEAFVVDVSDGGAEYFTVPLSNIWGTTLDLLDRTGSLNKAQSVANEDGSYTYVISADDPGVANWIDSDGLREGILTLRMAEFGKSGPREDLGARGRVIKLDRLDAEVPHLRRVSAQERATQLAERRNAYLRRLPEGTA